MRKLGIDFGTKKVGLALTDEAGKMAFPHDVILNDSALLGAVEALVDEKKVTEIVFGHSLNLAGEVNPVQADIEAFMGELSLRCPIPMHLEPEQLTSQQAAAVTGKNDQIDAAAAAIILDTWLQKQSNVTSAPASETKEDTEEEVSEITFDQFTAVEIKIGTIKEVEIVEGADKLLKLTVDLGETSPRQILSGIREYYQDEQVLVGLQCPFITNLAPRKIRGFESQGMILAGDSGDTFALLNPSNPLPPGTRLH